MCTHPYLLGASNLQSSSEYLVSFNGIYSQTLVIEFLLFKVKPTVISLLEEPQTNYLANY